MNRCGTQLCLLGALTVTPLSPCLGGESRSPWKKSEPVAQGRRQPEWVRRVLASLSCSRPGGLSTVKDPAARGRTPLPGGWLGLEGPGNPLGRGPEHGVSHHRRTPRPCSQVSRAVVLLQDL